MKALRDKLVPGAIAIAALALPTPAAAASVVPPENSAATQYTEAIPTGGGQKDADKPGGGNVSPAAVLGADKAQKLESQGRAGREAAEVVAATAPSPAPEPAPAPERAPAGGGDESKAEPQAGGPGAKRIGLGDEQVAAPPPSQPVVRHVDIPAGSSGLSEVLAQATGSSSSGQLGALLPLLILAVLAWALAFFWRQRQRTA